MDWIMLVVWGVFILATVVIELETADLVTIWFTIGGIGALIAALCKVDPLFQLAIFTGISLVLVLTTRPLTKKMMQKDIIKTNADRVVGMIGVVTKEFHANEIGEVKVDNNLWRATNLTDSSFAVGEKVSIEAISGTKLIVIKLDNENSNVVII